MILFDFFKKQKAYEEKKKTTKILINSLKIPENQKRLFLESLEDISPEQLDKMYNELTNFIKELELKELEDIRKSNFTNIA